jgi:hypothetical protein
MEARDAIGNGEINDVFQGAANALLASAHSPAQMSDRDGPPSFE